MISRQIIYLHENNKATKVTTMETEQLHNRHRRHCLNLQREIYDMYMNQFQQFNKLNFLVDVDLNVLNFSILGMMNWFYRWYKPGKRLNEEEVAHHMIKIILSGILKGNEKTVDITIGHERTNAYRLVAVWV